MLEKFYEMNGWGKKTDTPIGKTISEMGLSNVADDLVRLGVLSDCDGPNLILREKNGKMDNAEQAGEKLLCL